jgi:hypothetical protein
LTHAGIERRQLVQRLIERKQIARSWLGCANPFVQHDFESRARTLRGPMCSRVIDENPPHHLRRHAEEMRAILPGDPLLTDQPEIHLMDQCCRLQSVVPTLVAKVGGRSSSELSINERQQIVPRLQVTPPPGPNKIAGGAGSISH